MRSGSPRAEHREVAASVEDIASVSHACGDRGVRHEALEHEHGGAVADQIEEQRDEEGHRSRVLQLVAARYREKVRADRSFSRPAITMKRPMKRTSSDQSIWR